MGRSGVTSLAARVAGASGEIGGGLCASTEYPTGPWLSSAGLNCSTESFAGFSECLTGVSERLTGVSERLTGVSERSSGLSERSTGLSRYLTGVFG